MAFYSRIIKLQGVSYKQISFDAWQNLTTGEILDNTRMSGIINLVADGAVVPTVPAVILGACCTGGICVGEGQTAQDFCPPSVGIFYPGVTCAECFLGACCTGGTCYGGQLTSQSICTSVGGTFYLGLTCNRCEIGVFCTGGGSSRTCIRTGYRGEQLSNEFQPGATCSYCTVGTCCINGEGTVGVRQSNCTGVFFAGIFNLNACDSGSCCVGATCNENVFRYDCGGVFNSGLTCIACSNGSCCLPGGGCTLTSMGTCMATGGTFFGGATCSACDIGVCCNNGICTDQRRGNVCAGTFYAGANCSSTPCEQGACCTGGNCISNTEAINCQNINGTFFSGVTCIACATGANCLSDLEINGDRVCTSNQFFGNVTDGTFYQNQGCSACQSGVCCNQNGGGVAGIRGDCTTAGATFFAGQTLYICDAGVFCTGSGTGQTCFGLGYRGQSLTNNFIVGATCSSCILGVCCTGGTCLNGGLTSQASCNSAGGLFFAGSTCKACDYGVYCTGATCLSLGYRGQSLSNNFIVGATCSSCILGACCTGGTCSGGGQTSQAACNGLFIAGATCVSCDYGVFCTGATCAQIGYRSQNISNNFIIGATCSSCILGACCTGGTCYGGGQTSLAACEAVSGIFYAGLTCSQCVTGVCCTGGTCSAGGIVYQGQCTTSIGSFIAGGTCSDCSTGICCTGGTCSGGGITSASACASISGVFYPSSTSCSVCVDNVNCCIGGTHHYVSRTACEASGGIVFEGSEDPLTCESGAFCTGATCAGVTLYGYELSNNFIINGDCGDCIYGACCGLDNEYSYTTQNICKGAFTPGVNDPNYCTVGGVTYGICCTGVTCSSNIEKSECTGYFVSNTDAATYGITCGINPCETGICCGESGVTSATGGVCLGVMTRAECAVTGGDFFSISEGYTCSNCLYIPMLASAVFSQIASDIQSTNLRKTKTFSATDTGFTGNEIQPVDETKIGADTWIDATTGNAGNYHGSGATLNVATFNRDGDIGAIQALRLGSGNFSIFRAWFDSGVTLHAPVYNGVTAISYDDPPAGKTSDYGRTLGYLAGANNTDVYPVARYLRLVLGYNNPDDVWHGTELVYRFMGLTGSATTSRKVNYSLNDATVHAGLTVGQFNVFPNPTPFITSNGGVAGYSYSSPILVQVFAENPLKYRIRPVGSCCKGVTCVGIMTQDQCNFTGGTFNVNSGCVSCYPELIIGNCCTGGTYYGYTAQSSCLSIGGYFKKGATTDRNVCIYGTECGSTENCVSSGNIYYGQFGGSAGYTFVVNSDLGCSACDRGICCVGLTCNGYIPRATCDSLSGTFYENESSCGEICNVGVCCNIDTGGCGTYTNAGNCRQPNQVFLSGYTQGQTCSACTSLLTLTSNSSGVTFTFTLNKGTTYGTFYDGTYWVQETSDLRLVQANLQYMTKNSKFADGSTGATLDRYSANSKIEGLTLTSGGYKGTVYVHGLAKNPVPLNYYKQDGTTSFNNNQPFNSISYYEYDKGWKGPYGTSSTENPNNYEDFDLNKFEENRLALLSTGLTLSGTDVIVFNCSNFDITKSTSFPGAASGYPYQVQTNRSNTLAYGVLNCISATAAALAGSTTCFRPPIQWPEEDRINRPIYPISLINNKIPGTPGNTLITLTTLRSDAGIVYSTHTAKSPTQFSEFGFGVDYNVTAPYWAMFGENNDNSSSTYGEQFIFPLHDLLYATWAFRTSGLSLTFEQRRDGIARIVQYGLDSYGPCIVFCTNLGSGAGQKAGRTRGWIPIAGYFLGVTAMYDVEATMLNDINRSNAFFESAYTSTISDTPGRTCASFAEWNTYRFGDTGPSENYLGKRRFISNVLSHETNTMMEVVNDPSNLVRHYDYLGSIYRGTTVAGFGPTGATGITFYNASKSFIIDPSNKISVSGNFGVMQWGSTLSASNPYPGRFSYSSKEGDATSFNSMWVKVESGPGAGNTYYKVLHMLGSFRPNSDGSVTTATNNQGGGFQIILGSTWTHGIPDHTSVLSFYPFVLDDVSITRPSAFDANGATGCVIFMTNNGPQSGCPAFNKSIARLYDANSSPSTPYFTNSLDAWATQWLFVDYIERTKGISLNSKAIPMADYAKQYIYTSPYNIMGLYAWDTGFNSVFAAFAGADLSSTAQRDRINFTKYYPGITSWKYV